MTGSMVKVMPREIFTGYPDGVKRVFAPGFPETVPAEYASLLERKQLADRIVDKVAQPKRVKKEDDE